MRKKINFEYADAWLLLSIIYANQKGAADLLDIIGYGDFINHSIFSVEELQGGIYRLIESGYVMDENGKYISTEKIMTPYKQFKKKNISVYKEISFIQKQLDSPDWSIKYNPLKANKSGSYEKIKREIVEEIYKKHFIK